MLSLELCVVQLIPEKRNTDETPNVNRVEEAWKEIRTDAPMWWNPSVLRDLLFRTGVIRCRETQFLRESGAAQPIGHWGRMATLFLMSVCRGRRKSLRIYHGLFCCLALFIASLLHLNCDSFDGPIISHRASGDNQLIFQKNRSQFQSYLGKSGTWTLVYFQTDHYRSHCISVIFQVSSIFFGGEPLKCLMSKV